MDKFLIISSTTELFRFSVEQIIYIVADGNSSNICLLGSEQKNSNMQFVSKQLGEIEKILDKQILRKDNSLIRIGKSLIINRNYIYSIHVSKQILEMMDLFGKKYQLSASKEALQKLKQLIEKEQI